MSGRPALDINKLMEARPFSTNHSSLSRRWSLRSLYTCYVSFKEIDSLPRIGESVSSSFPRYVLHQQIHCQGMVDHLWLQMHWNPPRSQNGSSPIMDAGHYDHSKLAGYRSKTANGTVKWWYIIVTIIAWLRGRWSIWVLRRSTASLADCNHRL